MLGLCDSVSEAGFMDGVASPRQRHLTSRLGRIAPCRRALLSSRASAPAAAINERKSLLQPLPRVFSTFASTRPLFYGLSLFSSISSSARPSFSRQLSGVALHVPPTLALCVTIHANEFLLRIKASGPQGNRKRAAIPSTLAEYFYYDTHTHDGTESQR